MSIDSKQNICQKSLCLPLISSSSDYEGSQLFRHHEIERSSATTFVWLSRTTLVVLLFRELLVRN